MRKKDDTLRETILTLAQETAQTLGPQAINIRDIAKKAGIATGTVYNYFKSKDEILLALTQNHWHKALAEMEGHIKGRCFVDQLAQIYAYLRRHISQSAGVLMGSLQKVQAAGQEQMTDMHRRLGQGLVKRMEQDEKIRPDVWSETFTQKDYADFVLMNLIIYLRTGAEDISFFIEMVKRTLY